jgi:hypothetical protein
MTKLKLPPEYRQHCEQFKKFLTLSNATLDIVQLQECTIEDESTLNKDYYVFRFEIRLKDNPFITQHVFQPTDALINLISTIGKKHLGFDPSWDSDRHIGWFYFEVKKEKDENGTGT